MQIDRNVTWGNIVSWVMILIGLAVGYAGQVAATRQNAKDVAEAKALAVSAAEAVKVSDAIRTTQINALTVSVAETAVTVKYMDKKLDELVADSRVRSLTPASRQPVVR